MRHVLSLIYGLVGTLAAWLAVGISHTAFRNAGIEASGNPVPAEIWANSKLIGYAALVVAGLILGFLATLRLSPAGAILAGALLIGGQVVYEYKASWLRLDFLVDALKLDDQAMVAPAASYVQVVVAVMLLTAAFSISRWRNPKAVEESTGPGTPEAPLGSAALNDSFGQQPIDPFAPAAPTYEPAPAAPGQPSMYVDDGEAATTQLPNPHQQQPGHQPPFPAQ